MPNKRIRKKWADQHRRRFAAVWCKNIEDIRSVGVEIESASRQMTRMLAATLGWEKAMTSHLPEDREAFAEVISLEQQDAIRDAGNALLGAGMKAYLREDDDEE